MGRSDSKTKNWVLFFAGGAIPVGLVGLLLFALWVKDVRDDQKHTIIVNASTPVFAGVSVESCWHGTLLTTIDRGTQLRVERIRYLKDCATFDVTLPDGRKGYLVLGDGDISVKPHLPTS